MIAYAPPTCLILTPGDPAGIGAEIAMQAWQDRAAADIPPFVLLDDPARLAELAANLGWAIPIEAVTHPAAAAEVFPTALPVLAHTFPARVQPGQPDPANGGAVVDAIGRAVELTHNGMAKAIVTNPIAKHVLQTAGFAHPGHTEYLAHLAGSGGPAPTPVMMLTCPELSVVPVTIHLPLKEVPAALTRERLLATLRITAEGLKRDFGIARPRLAVAGLNPHAGEDGRMGREEIDTIAPVLDTLRAEGEAIAGPLSADTLFHSVARARYDAAVCMYHDQALIPIKTVDFARGVNVTLGLPFVRTSPDHGTAFEIAGTGRADATSLVEALKTARFMADNRTATQPRD